MIDFGWWKMMYTLIKYRKVIKKGCWISAKTVPRVMGNIIIVPSRIIVGQFSHFTAVQNDYMMIYSENAPHSVYIAGMKPLSEKEILMYKLSN